MIKKFAKFTIFVAIAFVATSLTTGQAVAQSNAGGIRSDAENEKVIRALYDGFVKGWNEHDWEKIAAMWALDGDHQEPDGRVAKGRDEITALLKKQHETVFKKTTLSLTVEGVWFVSESVALVTGDYSIQGIVLPDGNKLAPRGGFITSILIKDRGEWLIAASRLMIPSVIPYRQG